MTIETETFPARLMREIREDFDGARSLPQSNHQAAFVLIELAKAKIELLRMLEGK